MPKSKYEPHRDHEKFTGVLGRREIIADQGKFFRIVRTVMTHPIWEVASPTTQIGKLIRLLLIFVGTSILIVEAIASSPWPLVIVITLVFFAIGWAKAGSSNS